MIGVFDSGIGGLSILKQLITTVSSDYICLADQANMPYGDKTPEFIRHRAVLISSYLVKLGCSTIVIGCNTATLNTPISLLRKQFPKIKFVGVEPPIKPLIQMPATQLLLVTPATYKSEWLRLKLRQFDPKELTVLDCPGLAEAIEQINYDRINKILNNLLSNNDTKQIKAVGIGCTHYSLIKSLIQDYFPVPIYDPSESVANRVKELIGLESSNNQNNKLIVLTTNLGVSRLKQQVTDLLSITTQVKSIKL